MAETRSLRDLTRETVRELLADRALELFDERGFDNATVDDIAAQAGISTRSFFRYFQSKEDVVIDDPIPHGLLVKRALLERPAKESPWAALRAAFQPLVEIIEDDPPKFLRVARVMLGAPSLRARNLEKHGVWAAMLVPIIAERIAGDPELREVAAGALFYSALASFDVALGAWTERDGDVPLSTLVDAAFQMD